MSHAEGRAITVDSVTIPAAVTGGDSLHGAGRRGSPRATVALMCVTVAFIYGSGTILFSAMATVAEQLDASQTQMQWVAGIYPLVIAALLLPGGAFADRVGRKVGVVLGLAVSAAFFLAASLTTDARLVILSMGLAGIGGAIAFPATLATITAVVPRERRGPAVGLWSASLFLGGLAGTTLGGLLSEFADWKWLLIGPGVLGLLVIVPVLRYVPESRDPANAVFDLRGTVFSVLAVGLFVFGLTEAPSRGWTDPVTQTCFLGLIFGVLFVWSQLSSPRPMLDVRLFAEGRFGSGSLINLMSWFLAYGLFFTAVQYRYYTLGYGPLLTGISFVPGVVLVIPLALAGPRLARRFGSRPVMVAGALLLAGGSVGIAIGGATQGYWPVVICEAITFGGLGLVGGPATESIIDALPVARHGVASAVNDITRQLGIALGVAVLGSVFNAAYRIEVENRSGAVPAETLAATKNSAAEGLARAAELPDDLRAIQEDAIAQAAALGFVIAMVALAVTLFLAAWVVWRRCPADAGRAARTVPTPPADPALTAIPLSQQLVAAAEHYERLVRAAQARREDLERSIDRLELQEAELLRECAAAQAERARMTAELAELTAGSTAWLSGAYVDPIAAKPNVRSGAREMST